MPALDRHCLGKRTGKRIPPIWTRPFFSEMLLYLTLMFAFSVLWLLFARQFLGAGTSPELEKSINTPMLKAVALSSIVLAPFYEEVVFRGFFMEWLLNQLKRTSIGPNSKLVALVVIVITAIPWALCHLGQMEPTYVKWVQIFALGIVLGIARLRLGLEACILLHLLFNVGQIPLSLLERVISQLSG